MMSITVLSFSLFFVIGLAVGSFLNVVIFRYQPDGRLFDFKRLGGRSRCRSCHRQLRWHELIPVASFLIQGGRCRQCGEKLSWQYPIVELLTGFAFVLPLLFFYPHYTFPTEHSFASPLSHLWLAVALIMILIAALDARLMIIPHELTGMLALIGFAFAFLKSGSFLGSYAVLVPGPHNVFVNHLLAGIVGAALLGCIVVVSRGRAMGMGDVFLAGAMGLLLGFPDSILALALAFLLGGAWSSAALLFGPAFVRRLAGHGARGALKRMVPFGPFLVLGFWSHIFFGHTLVEWYVSLI